MTELGQELLTALAMAGRVCVGLILLLAAMQKAAHWRLLPGVIANYRLLPRAMVLPVAVVLPLVEMIVGVLVLSAQLSPFAELTAIGLLILFAAAMAVNLRRGRAHIDCGCGRPFLKQTLRWSLVARNAVLAALLLPSFGSVMIVSMPLLLTGAGAGLCFVLLYSLHNTLAALPERTA
jgi:hypothetical protein